MSIIREAELIAPGQTNADAYFALSGARYRLMRTQKWTPEVLERLRSER